MANPKTATTIIAGAILILAAVSLPHLTNAQPTPAPISAPPTSTPALAPEPFPTAPSPGLDCFPYLIKLSDCLTFVETGSNLTKPDPGCCPELGNLVDTQPICLCQLLGDPSKVGLTVDINKALTLPSVCNVTTPPVSLCAAIGIPVSGLTPSEAPSASAGGPMAGSPIPGSEDTGSPNSLASNTNQNFFIGLAVVLFTYFI